jgi:hypothetical protein
VPPTYPYNPNGDLSDDELGLRDTDNDSDNDADIDLNDEQQEERVNGQFAAPGTLQVVALALQCVGCALVLLYYYTYNSSSCSKAY